MGHISALEAARENTVPCVGGAMGLPQLVPRTLILLDIGEYLTREKDENPLFPLGEGLG